MLELFILGLIQGITEFLPVSSSAHLVIGEKIMGLEYPGLIVEITLHFASFVALLIYFNTEIWDLITNSLKYLIKKSSYCKQQFSLMVFLIVTTLISGITGIILEQVLGEYIKHLAVTGTSLIITGCLLILIEKSHKFHFIFLKQEQDLFIKDSFFMGICQGLSVIPGISRSGITVIAGISQGYSKDLAVKLSFLLAFPIILGSFVYKLPSLIQIYQNTPSQAIEMIPGLQELIVSFVACLLASIIGIKSLISLVKRSKLSLFAIYVIFIGIIILVSISM
ncbi:undecaprenyl-diphosphate phosphatase [Natranaerobius thermophilus]|uniref:Undecaprenyl-diphosphatase n=1 Tax=Natranaerobius thermophilus (strain ATCC BAA-1301 / DSM 18059 / JW/NM-WN-LF) TaxID=457570 RepID=B2A5I6_NATTJ|nr:undecaprenyl-diphosphate phosphatase [Natranaerobius thermophilus]ACB85341.1 Bacitracin resistance protein BacA [Natranaerobius thermophilus JW/NM-WN-LF]